MVRIGRIYFVLLAIAGCAVIANAQGPQSGRAPGLNRLICIENGATCTLGTGQDRNTAVLDALDLPASSWAGVRTAQNLLAGKPVEELSDLRFTYAGYFTVTVPPSYAPWLRIPIDMDSDGTTEIYMFVLSTLCDDGAGNVDVTGESDCFVFDTRSSAPYTGMAAYLAANPGFRVATDNFPYIFAHGSGLWTISNVSLGRPGNR